MFYFSFQVENNNDSGFDLDPDLSVIDSDDHSIQVRLVIF